MKSTSTKGREGEDRAVAFLIERGYKVVKRNLRSFAGEVDIVVYKDEIVRFVEVKTWGTLSPFELEQSIDARKRQRIVRCAEVFLRTHPQFESCSVRFDVVALDREGRLTHFIDAFTENGFE